MNMAVASKKNNVRYVGRKKNNTKEIFSNSVPERLSIIIDKIPKLVLQKGTFDIFSLENRPKSKQSQHTSTKNRG